ncbi:hypothetical protein HGC82_002087 [Campylobacter coli]|nr:hypothetical protein [Campylobacter coli]EFB0736974.1 hypothetical protein [Campylobacter coli]EFB0737609.1 hypothetical protein [Campylobacter coli]EFB7038793.1 hypothetical protein [Campylobacter coli]EFN2610314.1 hypothetical protein [Campylobacter coli]
MTKSLTIPVFSYKAFEANSFGDFSLGNGPLTALSPLKVLGVITGGTSGMAGNFTFYQAWCFLFDRGCRF